MDPPAVRAQIPRGCAGLRSCRRAPRLVGPPWVGAGMGGLGAQAVWQVQLQLSSKTALAGSVPHSGGKPTFLPRSPPRTWDPPHQRLQAHRGWRRCPNNWRQHMRSPPGRRHRGAPGRDGHQRPRTASSTPIVPPSVSLCSPGRHAGCPALVPKLVLPDEHPNPVYSKEGSAENGSF